MYSGTMTRARAQQPAEPTLEAVQAERKLIEAQVELGKLKILREGQRRQQQYLEHLTSDGWGSLVDPYEAFRQAGFYNQNPFYTPYSQAGDRKHGDNWPLYRDWMELARQRQASRVLTKSNGYAIGTLKNLTNYTIGEGFSYNAVAKQSVPDADPERAGRQTPEQVDRLVRLNQSWLDDFLKRNRWWQREREAYRRQKRDGEYFLRLFYDTDGSTRVRFVEPEQIVDPPGATRKDGWSYGIRHQMDPEDVETVIEYHVAHMDPTTVDRKPGEPTVAVHGDYVPANEIVHVKDLDEDSNVKRGLPAFSYDVILAFRRASKLQANLSIGAAIRAATAETWQHQTGTQSQIQSFADLQKDWNQTNPVTGRGENIEKYEPGMVRRVPAGQSLVQPPTNTGTPEHLQAVQGDLRLASTAFAAPEYMTGDASNANYASTLIASAPFTRAGKAEQKWARESFLETIERARRWAVECRVLPLESLELVDIQCEAPAVVSTDPLQDAQRDQIYVGIRAKSPQTCTMQQGLDPDTELANIEEFESRFGQAGQQLPLPGDDGQGGGFGGFGGGLGGANRYGGGNGTGQGVLLDVPDVRQSTDYSCGRAAVLSVARYHGLNPTVDQLSGALGTDPVDGTSPTEIVRGIQSLGLQTLVGEMELGDLAQLLAQGAPVLTPITSDAGGHWVVVIGYDDQDLVIQDPVAGRVTMPAYDFEARWRDRGTDGEDYDHYGIAVFRGQPR